MRQIVSVLFALALWDVSGCTHATGNVEQYAIVVDYSQSLSQMIDRSNCIVPWHRVTEQNFPLKGMKTREAAVVLFKVN